jgi:hypothetical protein
MEEVGICESSGHIGGSPCLALNCVKRVALRFRNDSSSWKKRHSTPSRQLPLRNPAHQRRQPVPTVRHSRPRCTSDVNGYRKCHLTVQPQRTGRSLRAVWRTLLHGRM